VSPFSILLGDRVSTFFRYLKLTKLKKLFRGNKCFWVTFAAKVWKRTCLTTTTVNKPRKLPLKITLPKALTKTCQKTVLELGLRHSVIQWPSFFAPLAGVENSNRSKHGLSHTLLFRRTTNFKQSKGWSALCRLCPAFTPSWFYFITLCSRIRESQPSCESCRSRTVLGSHFEETFMNNHPSSGRSTYVFCETSRTVKCRRPIYDRHGHMILFLCSFESKTKTYFLLIFFFNVMRPRKPRNKKKSTKNKFSFDYF
jgi:hypothetical protein